LKTIGLLGGMSWESTLEYYRIINQKINLKLGALRSGKILLYSYDFQEIEELQAAEKWGELTLNLTDKALMLEGQGADFILICTNTMHIAAEQIENSLTVPLLHIVDAVAAAIKAMNISRIGLLGTKFTMEKDFYKKRLSEKHHYAISVPTEVEQEIIHQIIYSELCKGVIDLQSRAKLVRIIENLARRGCEGVILGCTELPLIIKPEDVSLPVFDSTEIHASAAVEMALK